MSNQTSITTAFEQCFSVQLQAIIRY